MVTEKIETIEELGLDSEQRRVFRGKYDETMPILLISGYKPASPAEIMGHYVALGGIDRPFSTDFGAAADKDNVYLMPRSPRLRVPTHLMGSDRVSFNGILLRPDDLPAGTKVYSRQDPLFNQGVSEQKAYESQFLLDFAEGNTDVLRQYVEINFRWQNRDRERTRALRRGAAGLLVPYRENDPDPTIRASIIDSSGAVDDKVIIEFPLTFTYDGRIHSSTVDEEVNLIGVCKSKDSATTKTKPGEKWYSHGLPPEDAQRMGVTYGVIKEPDFVGNNGNPELIFNLTVASGSSESIKLERREDMRELLERAKASTASELDGKVIEAYIGRGGRIRGLSVNEHLV